MFTTLIRSHPTPPENPHTYMLALGRFKRIEGTRPSTSADRAGTKRTLEFHVTDSLRAINGPVRPRGER